MGREGLNEPCLPACAASAQAAAVKQQARSLSTMSTIHFVPVQGAQAASQQAGDGGRPHGHRYRVAGMCWGAWVLHPAGTSLGLVTCMHVAQHNCWSLHNRHACMDACRKAPTYGRVLLTGLLPPHVADIQWGINTGMGTLLVMTGELGGSSA